MSGFERSLVIKLLQLNAWMFRLEEPLKDLILREDPDIICLQEVISYPSGYSGLLTTIEKLQNSWDYPYMFFSPVVSFKHLKHSAKFGNAILSKHKFESTNAIFTNGTYVDNFNFEDHDYNIRNLQHVVFGFEKTKINILNHHGLHVRQHKNGTPETDKQMLIIADYISSLSGPVIFTGDLNLSPSSSSLRPINKLLRNLSIEFNLQTTRNYLSPKKEVCDYIFINDSVKIKKFTLLDDVISDHAALTLDFEL